MTDRSQEEIKAKLTEVLERETERGNRLKFLIQVAELTTGVLKTHDLHMKRVKAEGADEKAVMVMENVAAPFKSHLELLKSALELYREVAEGPEKQPEEPPDDVA